MYLICLRVHPFHPESHFTVVCIVTSLFAQQICGRQTNEREAGGGGQAASARPPTPWRCLPNVCPPAHLPDLPVGRGRGCWGNAAAKQAQALHSTHETFILHSRGEGGPQGRRPGAWQQQQSRVEGTAGGGRPMAALLQHARPWAGRQRRSAAFCLPAPPTQHSHDCYLLFGGGRGGRLASARALQHCPVSHIPHRC